MKEDRPVARDADVRGQRELAASSSRPSPDGGDRDSRHLAEPLPVDQHHRLPGAVILVVDLDAGEILLANDDLGMTLSFQD